MSDTRDTRFRPGQSGNRNGRPRKPRPSTPLDDLILDQTHVIHQAGVAVELNLEQALQIRLAQLALQSDVASEKTVTGWLLERQQARRPRTVNIKEEPEVFIIMERDSDNAFEAMQILDIAVKTREPNKSSQEFPVDCSWVSLRQWTVKAALTRAPELEFDRELMDLKIRHTLHEGGGHW